MISVVNTNEDLPNAHQAPNHGRRRWSSFLVKIEGIRSTRNTHNTDPFNTRTDESPALCHPYLQLCCRRVT